MARHFLKDARLLFLFVLFFVFAGKIFVVAQIAFRFVLVFLFVQIVRNQVQVDGMRLRYFQLRFAFGAAQNLAFFHFVFIDVNLGGTFRTANHDDDLRYLARKRWLNRPRHLASYYIPCIGNSTPAHRTSAAGTKRIRRVAWLPHENTLSARWSGSAAW